MDQQPADAAVAVDVGVDRLELGVRDRGVHHRVHAAAGDEAHQILHQRRHLLRRRTLEDRRLAVVADPHGLVSPRAEVARQQLAVRGQQAAVAPVEPLRRDRLAGPVGVKRREDVRRHQLGVLGIEVGPGVAQVRQSDRQYLTRGRDPLDLRRRHGVGPDQHRARVPQHPHPPGRMVTKTSDRSRRLLDRGASGRPQRRHRQSRDPLRHRLCHHNPGGALVDPRAIRLVVDGCGLTPRRRPSHHQHLHTLASMFRQSYHYLNLTSRYLGTPPGRTPPRTSPRASHSTPSSDRRTLRENHDGSVRPGPTWPATHHPQPRVSPSNPALSVQSFVPSPNLSRCLGCRVKLVPDIRCPLRHRPGSSTLTARDFGNTTACVKPWEVRLDRVSALGLS